MPASIVLIVIGLFVLVFIFYKGPKKYFNVSLIYKEILLKHVGFYENLDEQGKIHFEEKVKEFLSYVHIEGVDTQVDDVDRILVASSAVIPIFGFPGWRYYNLSNVLLYPQTFNREEFLAGGYEKNTLGMVGSGAMQRMMILSKPALHNGFARDAGNANTGVHEFVHSLDKEDGDIDGLPEALLKRNQSDLWLQLVNKNMELIIAGESDINSYAATNKAEFFAVTSEYFFNNPVSFKEMHQDLYEAMTEIFNQQPGSNAT